MYPSSLRRACVAFFVASAACSSADSPPADTCAAAMTAACEQAFTCPNEHGEGISIDFHGTNDGTSAATVTQCETGFTADPGGLCSTFTAPAAGWAACANAIPTQSACSSMQVGPALLTLPAVCGTNQ
jgi:hypothetical protein